jgi:hypothetical protein
VSGNTQFKSLSPPQWLSTVLQPLGPTSSGLTYWNVQPTPLSEHGGQVVVVLVVVLVVVVLVVLVVSWQFVCAVWQSSTGSWGGS